MIPFYYVNLIIFLVHVQIKFKKLERATAANTPEYVTNDLCKCI